MAEYCTCPEGADGNPCAECGKPEAIQGVPARDRLDYLEQRARRKQHDVDNNPALQDAEYQAGAMFGCKDVLALVKVARAAREYMECFDLRGVEVAISDEAFAALRAALGRLDGPDKEQPKP